MHTVAEAPSIDPIWFIDNLVHPLIGGEQTDGEFSLAELTGRRGDMPPLHVHHRDHEAFHVLEGELSLFVGDRHLVVPAGRAALGPRGIPHTYRVESEIARWLVISTPSGFEQFLRAAGEPAERDELPPQGRGADPERLARLAAEEGIEILGAPGMLPTEL